MKVLLATHPAYGLAAFDVDSAFEESGACPICLTKAPRFIGGDSQSPPPPLVGHTISMDLKSMPAPQIGVQLWRSFSYVACPNTAGLLARYLKTKRTYSKLCWLPLLYHSLGTAIRSLRCLSTRRAPSPSPFRLLSWVTPSLRPPRFNKPRLSKDGFEPSVVGVYPSAASPRTHSG
jgi:hypothetical protein